jgi:hypothetical protein
MGGHGNQGAGLRSRKIDNDTRRVSQLHPTVDICDSGKRLGYSLQVFKIANGWRMRRKLSGVIDAQELDGHIEPASE